MKIYLETYGCQMNEYDSELILSILKKADHKIVNSADDADVAFLNTCAIRENAHKKIYHRLDEMRGRKKRGQKLVVGVLGCMAQSLREELKDNAPVVDIIAGPDSYKRLPGLISEACGGDTGYDLSLSEYETYSDVAPVRVPGVNAWIAIMRGCDNFCTFCVVPYTRGRERSRSPQNIVAETEAIVAQGFKQVTLLGQNVNSYKYGNYDFADLMKMVGDVPGMRRVRFTSPHPKDFPLKLLQVMKDHPKLCNQIHLPLQSGSTQVLDRMNRTYSKQEFLDVVNTIRDTIPDVSLSTDIICGFCGETEQDFQDTVDVVKQVEFDSAFIFKYSERKNTIASRKFPDDVSEEIKSERVKHLVEIQRAISLERNEKEVGKTFDVLIEQPSKKNREEWLGRSDHNKGVVFSAPQYKPGDFVKVKITSAGTHTLRGEIVTPAIAFCV